MPVLVVATSASAWLLIGAGLMKIRRPEETDGAIRILTGADGTIQRVRLLGMMEVVVGFAFIVLPGPLTAAALGVAYLGVFGSALILSRRDADCGCFGSSGAKVGTSHLVVTLCAATASLGLTLAIDAAPDPSLYLVVASGVPVAMVSYALMAPLASLRSDLAELSA